MSKDTSGPAFPTKGGIVFYFPEHAEGQMRELAEQTSASAEGMTLRDWFAGQVISGICASGPGNAWTNDKLAGEAYRLADAMLLEKLKK